MSAARKSALGPLLATLFLCVGTLLAFQGVRGNGFVAFDDDVYITNNPHVLAGLTLDGVRWSLTANAASNWHPLTWMSHMLDVSLFEENAGAHHLMSLALHLATGLLLFRFLLRTTGRPLPACATAALFLWHPLRVESVAWAAERKDVLSGLFFLATLNAYVTWARHRSGPRLALALLFFALGLMAKPMLVSLPLVLLLLDAWPLGRWREGTEGSPVPALRARVLEKLPFFLLAAASSVATVLAQRAGGAVVRTAEVTLPMRAGNALRSIAIYTAEFFVPRGLACFYPHPVVTGAAVLLPALLTLTGLGAVGFLAFRLRRTLPALGIGLAWFLLTSLPVLGLVQVGQQAHADRYTYLPGIGLALALAYGLHALAVARTSWAPTITRLFLLGLAALAFLTARQVRVWRSSETLFRHAIAVTGPNHRAEGNLGFVLLSRGDFEKAREHLTRALALLPGDATALLNLAVVDLRLDDFDDARTRLETLLRATPRDWRVHSNLGELELRTGHPDRAAAAYREALRLGSSSGQDRVNLGMAELSLGNTEAARAAFQAVTDPWAQADAAYGLGVLALGAEDPEGAAREFRTALELRPEMQDAWLGLAGAEAALGNAAGERKARRRLQQLRAGGGGSDGE